MLVDMDVFIHRSATCDGWYLRLVVVAFHRRQGVDGRGGRCRLPSWSLEWLSSCVIDHRSCCCCRVGGDSMLA